MNYLEQAERSLKYLADSEEDYARLKAGHQAEKERLKIVKAGLCIESTEKTVKGAENWSEIHPDYSQAVEDWQEFMESFYLVESKRKRAELTIEMFRSVNSSMKRGNI